MNAVSEKPSPLGVPVRASIPDAGPIVPRRSMARRLRLNSRMGILEDGTEVIPQLTPEQFHGPGSAHTGYSEYNQRALLVRWADDLEKPMATAATFEVGGPRAQDADGRTPANTGGTPLPAGEAVTQA